jgi:hypothetical protein
VPSEGSHVRPRPADPTHVALGLVGNHRESYLDQMVYKNSKISTDSF